MLKKQALRCLMDKESPLNEEQRFTRRETKTFYFSSQEQQPLATDRTRAPRFACSERSLKMVKGKIVIRKIDCSKSRQVTFFKRRMGLIKKAKELSILCDAEIGMVIFSCTGKLYEYASTSMRSVIERFNGMKQEHSQYEPIATEILSLQKETESLMKQLKCLQERHRHLMGEGLSKLSFEDLKQLEKLLEMSLKNIRTKKDESYQDERRELKRKANDVERANKELRKRLKMVDPDNEKIKGEAGEELYPMDESSSRSPLESPNDKEDMSKCILLQLSQCPKP